jgi:hypothetical protein
MKSRDKKSHAKKNKRRISKASNKRSRKRSSRRLISRSSKRKSRRLVMKSNRKSRKRRISQDGKKNSGSIDKEKNIIPKLKKFIEFFKHRIKNITHKIIKEVIDELILFKSYLLSIIKYFGPPILVAIINEIIKNTNIYIDYFIKISTYIIPFVVKNIYIILKKIIDIISMFINYIRKPPAVLPSFLNNNSDNPGGGGPGSGEFVSGSEKNKKSSDKNVSGSEDISRKDESGSGGGGSGSTIGFSKNIIPFGAAVGAGVTLKYAFDNIPKTSTNTITPKTSTNTITPKTATNTIISNISTNSLSPIINKPSILPNSKINLSKGALATGAIVTAGALGTALYLHRNYNKKKVPDKINSNPNKPQIYPSIIPKNNSEITTSNQNKIDLDENSTENTDKNINNESKDTPNKNQIDTQANKDDDNIDKQKDTSLNKIPIGNNQDNFSTDFRGGGG